MLNNNIIGHRDIRKYFHEAIKNNTLSHAHLIIGEDGIGKSLIAKEFAINIIGKTEIKEYVDIIEFRTGKGKKSIGVDEIRDIIEEISKKPFEGDKKVIIIYNGDRITTQAQNAFLKTIEEPPKGVYIFILCESFESILETIRSRCQIHKLNKLNNSDMKTFIKNKYDYLQEKEFQTVLAFCDGVPGRAEKIVEDENFKIIRNTIGELIIDLGTLREAGISKYADFFVKYKEEWEEVLSILMSYLRDILIYKDLGNEELIINKDMMATVKEAASLFSFNKLYNIIGIIDYTRTNLNSNTNLALSYEVMLLKMLEA